MVTPLSPPRIGSLCSGYGGLELGLQAVVGGTVAWHAEYDDGPAAVLAHHWPDVPNLRDITAVDWATVEPVEWLTAGWPCQPFSLAGQRKGSDDERHLWPHIARAIGVLRPRWFLGENVAGQLTLGMGTVLGDLAALGYDARWGVVRASDAGAAHRRERLFVLATDTDSERGDGRRTLSRRRPQPADRGDAVADPGGYAVREQPVRLTGRGGAAVVELAGTDAAADPDGAGRPRAEPAQRHDVPAWGTAADADGDGLEGFGRINGVGRDADGRGGADVAWGHGEPPTPLADPEHDGLDGAAIRCRTGAREDSRGLLEPQRLTAGPWGAYGPAIARWEHVTGRPAPRPTEPGRHDRPRLSPAFVEWLMGLPAGHVTAVPGLSRAAQLKALGNGVVPQQAALAVRVLLDLHARHPVTHPRKATA